MKTPHAVKVLAALAHDTRLAIYRLLVRQGPVGLSAGTIAERLDQVSVPPEGACQCGDGGFTPGRAIRFLLRQLRTNEWFARLSDRELPPARELCDRVCTDISTQAQARLALHVSYSPSRPVLHYSA